MRGLARHEDPDTSHDAAAQVDASTLMQEIYQVMANYGSAGCISDDVGDALPHHDVQTYTPRFIQMVQRGMIEVTGEKRKGHHNGRMQMVRRVLPKPWIPVEKTRKIVPTLPEDEPGKRVKYFQTQEGLDKFVETLTHWRLKEGLNIRITIEVM